jgi:hypothetical protein
MIERLRIVCSNIEGIFECGMAFVFPCRSTSDFFHRHFVNWYPSCSTIFEVKPGKSASSRETREKPLSPSIHSFPFCPLRLHGRPDRQLSRDQECFQEKHHGGRRLDVPADAGNLATTRVVARFATQCPERNPSAGAACLLLGTAGRWIRAVRRMRAPPCGCR